MKNIVNLLEEIKKNDYQINTFNIFIKDVNYKTKFLELIKKIKTVDEFKKINNVFPNVDKNLIRYIKTYSTEKDEVFKNIVLFNSNLYENGQQVTKHNKNITYKIAQRSNNTDKLCSYISYSKTFISDFIDKQNKKVILSIPMLKSEMFNKESINIDLKTNQKEFDSKIYTQGKKNYLLKKERFIEFTINKEQLLTNVRFVLPNVFIICLEDQSYLYQNKLILSDRLILNGRKFDNIIEKFIFIKSLYEEIYKTELDENNVLINLSIKRVNREKIKNNPFLFKLNTNIIITEKYINFKYITDHEDFLSREEIIKDCLEKQNKLISFFTNVDKYSLLFFDEKKINLIFSHAFNG